MNVYESGGAPDSTNRLLLKLAADPFLFKAMYAINSGKIGTTQRRRIEESPGLKVGTAWSGLDALVPLLTSVQMSKIEACAGRNDRTIAEQVAIYVGAASFQDYSSLYAAARWSDEETKELPPTLSQASPTQGAA
jgi:hypothetical protein